MLYYSETFSVPDDSPEAVNAYLNILRALFNLTNATHTNSSARSVTGQFFQQRKSLLATDSLGDSGENSKYTTDDNAEGIYKGGLSSRLRSLRRSLQQIALDTGLMEAGPPSPPTRAKESLDEYVRPQWEDEYTDVTLRTDPRYAPYYTAASMSPLEAYHFYRKIQCEAEQKLVFFEIEAIIKDPNARTAWLLLNTDFGMADMLAGLGIIPCRDRTSEQRPALEIFPAPSPPPPLDDWVRSRDPQAPPPLCDLSHRACAAGRSCRRRRPTPCTRSSSSRRRWRRARASSSSAASAAPCAGTATTATARRAGWWATVPSASMGWAGRTAPAGRWAAATRGCSGRTIGRKRTAARRRAWRWSAAAAPRRCARSG